MTHRCNNYNKECHRCRMNGDNNFGDYLTFTDSEGRQVKYLEKKSNGN